MAGTRRIPRGSPSGRASHAPQAGSPCGRTRPGRDRRLGSRGRRWSVRWWSYSRCDWSPESRFEGVQGYRRRSDPGPGYGPGMVDGIQVAEGTVIPLEEIEFRASRSSGPGGQHANVTASRIEAVFDVDASATLSDQQRALLQRKVGDRVTAVAQDARSQSRNRELALARLREKIAAGLRRPKPRRPTKPSRAARQRRLDQKRRTSQRKAQRRRPADD